MTPKKEIEKQAMLSVAHENYERKLNSYAFFRVSNRAISEDLVQDTFRKTWAYLLRGGGLM